MCTAFDRSAARVANLSGDNARVVSVALAGGDHHRLTLGTSNVTTAAARVSVTSHYSSGPWHGLAYVCDGSFTNEAVDPLELGDWLEHNGSDTDIAIIDGHGRLVVVELTDTPNPAAD